jgi:hypothetical protein
MIEAVPTPFQFYLIEQIAQGRHHTMAARFAITP